MNRTVPDNDDPLVNSRGANADVGSHSNVNVFTLVEEPLGSMSISTMSSTEYSELTIPPFYADHPSGGISHTNVGTNDHPQQRKECSSPKVNASEANQLIASGLSLCSSAVKSRTSTMASKKSVFDRLYDSRCDCKKSHEEVTETAVRNQKIAALKAAKARAAAARAQKIKEETARSAIARKQAAESAKRNLQQRKLEEAEKRRMAAEKRKFSPKISTAQRFTSSRASSNMPSTPTKIPSHQTLNGGQNGERTVLRKPAKVDYSKNNGVSKSRAHGGTISSQKKISPIDKSPLDNNSYQLASGLSLKENKELPLFNDNENTPEIKHSTSLSMKCEQGMNDFILMTLADRANLDKDFYSECEAHELALFLAMERAFTNEDLELPKFGCKNDDVEDAILHQHNVNQAARDFFYDASNEPTFCGQENILVNVPRHADSLDIFTATVNIQRIYRGRIARNIIMNALATASIIFSAMAIQKFYRHQKCRHSARLSLSAIKIQCVYRCYLRCRSRLESIRGCIHTQRILRGCFARSRYISQRRSVVKIQHIVRCRISKRSKTLIIAAVRIQSLSRRFYFRRRWIKTLVDIRIIQGFFRTSWARVFFVFVVNAAIVIQCFFRRLLSSLRLLRERFKSAQKNEPFLANAISPKIIQYTYRRHRSENWYQARRKIYSLEFFQKNDSIERENSIHEQLAVFAARIQIAYRRHRCFITYCKLAKRTTVIQKFLRGFFSQTAYKAFIKSSKKVQHIIRYKIIFKNRRRNVVSACIGIQCAARLFISRKRKTTALGTICWESFAASLIESRVRILLARRSLHEIKVASCAVKIQRNYRSFQCWRNRGSSLRRIDCARRFFLVYYTRSLYIAKRLSATTIQRSWRHQRARKCFLRLVKVSVIVQHAAEHNMHSVRLDKSIPAAVLIENLARVFVTRISLRIALSAAVKIQTFYRRLRCKRRVLMQKKILRAREIHRQLKMSIFIAVWFQSQHRYSICRNCFTDMKRKSVFIQKYIRRVQAIDHFYSLKKADILIKQWWRQKIELIRNALTEKSTVSKELPLFNDNENNQMTPEIKHSTSLSMKCEQGMNDFILMTLADRANLDKDFYSECEAHELALFLAMERAFTNEDLELPKFGCKNDDVEDAILHQHNVNQAARDFFYDASNEPTFCGQENILVNVPRHADSLDIFTATVNIQRIYRGRIARNIIMNALATASIIFSAMAIQKFYRHQKCRHSARLSLSAIKIQCVYRCYLRCRSRLESIRGCIHTQRILRGCFARSRYISQRRSVVKIQHIVRCRISKRSKTLIIAAVRIQSLSRRFYFRRRWIKTLVDIRIIQGFFRTSWARVFFVFVVNAAIVIQCFFRRLISSLRLLRERFKSAQKNEPFLANAISPKIIQYTYRRHRSENWYQARRKIYSLEFFQKNDSIERENSIHEQLAVFAARIQIAYRRHRCFITYCKLAKRTTVIQKFLRGFFSQTAYKAFIKSSKKVQHIIRYKIIFKNRRRNVVSACIGIQCAARLFISRKRKTTALGTICWESFAASLIESRVRILLARRSLHEIKVASCAVKIQRNYRSFQCWRNRGSSLRRIDCARRFFLVYYTRSLYIAKRLSATTIQRSWRHQRARKCFLRLVKVSVIVQHAAEHNMHSVRLDKSIPAAVLIENLARVFVTRISLRIALSAAVKIQTFYRRLRCKRRVLMQKKILRAREIHRQLKMSIFIAVWFQSQHRCNICRNCFTDMKRKSVFIQKYIRRVQAIDHFYSLKKADILIKQWWRQKIELIRNALTEKSAVKIQKSYRRYFSRCFLFLKIPSAVLIQSEFMACRIRRDLIRSIFISVRLQSIYRCNLLRNRFAGKKRNATSIQNEIRKHRAVRQFRAVKKAGILIKQWWRQKIESLFCALANAGSVEIQKTCRRYRCQRSHARNRASAVLIQRKFKTYKNRCELFRSLSVITQFQSIYRCHFCRNHFLEVKRMVKVIQNEIRRKKSTNSFLLMKRADTLVKHWWRQRIRRLQIYRKAVQEGNVLSRARENAEKNARLIIQSNYSAFVNEDLLSTASNMCEAELRLQFFIEKKKKMALLIIHENKRATRSEKGKRSPSINSIDSSIEHNSSDRFKCVEEILSESIVKRSEFDVCDINSPRADLKSEKLSLFRNCSTAAFSSSETKQKYQPKQKHQRSLKKNVGTKLLVPWVGVSKTRAYNYLALERKKIQRIELDEGSSSLLPKTIEEDAQNRALVLQLSSRLEDGRKQVKGNCATLIRQNPNRIWF